MRRLLVWMLLIAQALVLAGMFFASTFEMYVRSRSVAGRPGQASSRAASRTGEKKDGDGWME